MSIDRWVDKENVVYTHNRILFSLKEEGNSGICGNMDEPWRHFAKWNKPLWTSYKSLSLCCPVST